MTNINVIFPHPPDNRGGPSTFQNLLQSGLEKRGYSYSFYPHKEPGVTNIIVVVGGTRKIFWLLREKFLGNRVFIRLDGKKKRGRFSDKSFSNWLRGGCQDLLIAFIRASIANGIIYQSNYVRSLWEKNRKRDPRAVVIYNGSTVYGPKQNANGRVELLCVEGCVQGPSVLPVLDALRDYKLNLYGRLSLPVERYLLSRQRENIRIHGHVAHSYVLREFQEKRIFLNLETSPPCPNAVVEALCNGVPVVGFDSGSLAELVGDGGIVLPYGAGDPGRGDPPNVAPLNLAIEQIKKNYEKFSDSAVKRAKDQFCVEHMVDQYIEFFVH